MTPSLFGKTLAAASRVEGSVKGAMSRLGAFSRDLRKRNLPFQRLKVQSGFSFGNVAGLEDQIANAVQHWCESRAAPVQALNFRVK